MNLADFSIINETISAIRLSEEMSTAAVRVISKETYRKFISAFNDLGYDRMVKEMEKYLSWHSGEESTHLNRLHANYLAFFAGLSSIMIEMIDSGLNQMEIPAETIANLYAIPSYGDLLEKHWGRKPKGKLVSVDHLKSLIENFQKKIDPFNYSSLRYYPLPKD